MKQFFNIVSVPLETTRQELLVQILTILKTLDTFGII